MYSAIIHIMARLSVETYIPELDGWVEESAMKPGQKPRHIKQTYNPDGRRPHYLQLRVFPRSAVIELVDYVEEVEATNGSLFAVVKTSVAEKPPVVDNLKKGHPPVEKMIQTDHDTKPHRYRFRFE